MIANGCLWTAAHYKIPLLMLMHNNRAYHNELMGIQRTASRRSRGVDNVHLCARIENPFIDYAKVAQGLGVRAEGPIEDPSLLAAAIRREGAIELHVELGSRKAEGVGTEQLGVQPRCGHPPFREASRGPAEDVHDRPARGRRHR